MPYVYEREALALIDRKKNENYRAALDLLDRIRRLAIAAGHPERFAALNTRVGSEHKTGTRAPVASARCRLGS